MFKKQYLILHVIYRNVFKIFCYKKIDHYGNLFRLGEKFCFIYLIKVYEYYWHILYYKYVGSTFQMTVIFVNLAKTKMNNFNFHLILSQAKSALNFNKAILSRTSYSRPMPIYHSYSYIRV